MTMMINKTNFNSTNPAVVQFLKNETNSFKNPVHSFAHGMTKSEEFNDKLFSLVCDGPYTKRLLTKDELVELGFRGACFAYGITFYAGSMKE